MENSDPDESALAKYICAMQMSVIVNLLRVQKSAEKCIFKQGQKKNIRKC